MNVQQQTIKIRELNDILRKTFTGGNVLYTQKVASLDTEKLNNLVKQIQTFDDFHPDNDPYHQHDFGAVKQGQQNYFWKIDCYDKNFRHASPDSSNPLITNRVITIMHADEY